MLYCVSFLQRRRNISLTYSPLTGNHTTNHVPESSQYSEVEGFN